VKRIAVIGTGYVGLVTGTCFAELGNTVICVDNNEAKIELLRAGSTPFHEPHLAELIGRNLRAARLSFSTDLAIAVQATDIVFIAVDTPTTEDGTADLSAVRTVAASIGNALNGPKLVVSKSTAPVETGELIASLIAENSIDHHCVTVVSNPEFLREGSAVADFMQPDRIVIGTNDGAGEAILRELYRPLNAPIVVTDVRTSEMIKYAANAFLATKISFMNEIANICDVVDVDVETVAHGIGLDQRIGTQSMQAGIGFGGSCLPKDLQALEKIAAERQYDASLLGAVAGVNRRQIDRVIGKVAAALGGSVTGKTVAILGLAFKPDTDDIRGAPALLLIERLLMGDANVRAHDPVALEAVSARFGDRIVACEQIYDAVRGSDALVLATEWNEYKMIDFVLVKELMRGDAVIDGRNLFDPAAVLAAGLSYTGMGRRKARAAEVDAQPAREETRAS
jgi:UDPglucose 6-dehydrogenase